MPDKVVIDCSTGQAVTSPLTPAEQADQDKRQQDAADAAQAAQQARQQRLQDIAAFRAKIAGDPGLAALARILADRLTA